MQARRRAGHTRIPAGVQVPHPHRRILAAADHDQAPVELADGHRPDPLGVAGKGFIDGSR